VRSRLEACAGVHQRQCSTQLGVAGRHSAQQGASQQRRQQLVFRRSCALAIDKHSSGFQLVFNPCVSVFRPWIDSMPEAGERHLVQELRGVDMTA